MRPSLVAVCLCILVLVSSACSEKFSDGHAHGKHLFTRRRQLQPNLQQEVNTYRFRVRQSRLREPISFDKVKGLATECKGAAPTGSNCKMETRLEDAACVLSKIESFSDAAGALTLDKDTQMVMKQDTCDPKVLKLSLSASMTVGGVSNSTISSICNAMGWGAASVDLFAQLVIKSEDSGVQIDKAATHLKLSFKASKDQAGSNQPGKFSLGGTELNVDAEGNANVTTSMELGADKTASLKLTGSYDAAAKSLTIKSDEAKVNNVLGLGMTVSLKASYTATREGDKTIHKGSFCGHVINGDEVVADLIDTPTTNASASAASGGSSEVDACKPHPMQVVGTLGSAGMILALRCDESCFNKVMELKKSSVAEYVKVKDTVQVVFSSHSEMSVDEVKQALPALNVSGPLKPGLSVLGSVSPGPAVQSLPVSDYLAFDSLTVLAHLGLNAQSLKLTSTLSVNEETVKKALGGIEVPISKIEASLEGNKDGNDWGIALALSGSINIGNLTSAQSGLSVASSVFQSLGWKTDGQAAEMTGMVRLPIKNGAIDSKEFLLRLSLANCFDAPSETRPAFGGQDAFIQMKGTGADKDFTFGGSLSVPVGAAIITTGVRGQYTAETLTLQGGGLVKVPGADRVGAAVRFVTGPGKVELVLCGGVDYMPPTSTDALRLEDCKMPETSTVRFAGVKDNGAFLFGMAADASMIHTALTRLLPAEAQQSVSKFVDLTSVTGFATVGKSPESNMAFQLASVLKITPNSEAADGLNLQVQTKPGQMMSSLLSKAGVDSPGNATISMLLHKSSSQWFVDATFETDKNLQELVAKQMNTDALQSADASGGSTKVQIGVRIGNDGEAGGNQTVVGFKIAGSGSLKGGAGSELVSKVKGALGVSGELNAKIEAYIPITISPLGLLKEKAKLAFVLSTNGSDPSSDKKLRLKEIRAVAHGSPVQWMIDASVDVVITPESEFNLKLSGKKDETGVVTLSTSAKSVPLQLTGGELFLDVDASLTLTDTTHKFVVCGSTTENSTVSASNDSTITMPPTEASKPGSAVPLTSCPKPGSSIWLAGQVTNTQKAFGINFRHPRHLLDFVGPSSGFPMEAKKVFDYVNITSFAVVVMTEADPIVLDSLLGKESRELFPDTPGVGLSVGLRGSPAASLSTSLKEQGLSGQDVGLNAELRVYGRVSLNEYDVKLSLPTQLSLPELLTKVAPAPVKTKIEELKLNAAGNTSLAIACQGDRAANSSSSSLLIESTSTISLASLGSSASGQGKQVATVLKAFGLGGSGDSLDLKLELSVKSSTDSGKQVSGKIFIGKVGEPGANEVVPGSVFLSVDYSKANGADTSATTTKVGAAYAFTVGPGTSPAVIQIHGVILPDKTINLKGAGQFAVAILPDSDPIPMSVKLFMTKPGNMTASPMKVTLCASVSKAPPIPVAELEALPAPDKQQCLAEAPGAPLHLFADQNTCRVALIDTKNTDMLFSMLQAKLKVDMRQFFQLNELSVSYASCESPPDGPDTIPKGWQLKAKCQLGDKIKASLEQAGMALNVLTNPFTFQASYSGSTMKVAVATKINGKDILTLIEKVVAKVSSPEHAQKLSSMVKGPFTDSDLVLEFVASTTPSSGQNATNTTTDGTTHATTNSTAETSFIDVGAGLPPFTIRFVTQATFGGGSTSISVVANDLGMDVDLPEEDEASSNSTASASVEKPVNATTGGSNITASVNATNVTDAAVDSSTTVKLEVLIPSSVSPEKPTLKVFLSSTKQTGALLLKNAFVSLSIANLSAKAVDVNMGVDIGVTIGKNKIDLSLRGAKTSEGIDVSGTGAVPADEIVGIRGYTMNILSRFRSSPTEKNLLLCGGFAPGPVQASPLEGSESPNITLADCRKAASSQVVDSCTCPPQEMLLAKVKAGVHCAEAVDNKEGCLLTCSKDPAWLKSGCELVASDAAPYFVGTYSAECSKFVFQLGNPKHLHQVIHHFTGSSASTVVSEYVDVKQFTVMVSSCLETLTPEDAAALLPPELREDETKLEVPLGLTVYAHVSPGPGMLPVAKKLNIDKANLTLNCNIESASSFSMRVGAQVEGSLTSPLEKLGGKIDSPAVDPTWKPTSKLSVNYLVKRNPVVSLEQQVEVSADIHLDKASDVGKKVAQVASSLEAAGIAVAITDQVRITLSSKLGNESKSIRVRIAFTPSKTSNNSATANGLQSYVELAAAKEGGANAKVEMSVSLGVVLSMFSSEIVAQLGGLYSSEGSYVLMTQRPLMWSRAFGVDGFNAKLNARYVVTKERSLMQFCGLLRFGEVEPVTESLALALPNNTAQDAFCNFATGKGLKVTGIRLSKPGQTPCFAFGVSVSGTEQFTEFLNRIDPSKKMADRLFGYLQPEEVSVVFSTCPTENSQELPGLVPPIPGFDRFVVKGLNIFAKIVPGPKLDVVNKFVTNNSGQKEKPSLTVDASMTLPFNPSNMEMKLLLKSLIHMRSCKRVNKNDTKSPCAPDATIFELIGIEFGVEVSSGVTGKACLSIAVRAGLTVASNEKRKDGKEKAEEEDEAAKEKKEKESSFLQRRSSVYARGDDDPLTAGNSSTAPKSGAMIFYGEGKFCTGKSGFSIDARAGKLGGPWHPKFADWLRIDKVGFRVKLSAAAAAAQYGIPVETLALFGSFQIGKVSMDIKGSVSIINPADLGFEGKLDQINISEIIDWLVTMLQEQCRKHPKLCGKFEKMVKAAVKMKILSPRHLEEFRKGFTAAGNKTANVTVTAVNGKPVVPPLTPLKPLGNATNTTASGGLQPPPPSPKTTSETPKVPCFQLSGEAKKKCQQAAVPKEKPSPPPLGSKASVKEGLTVEKAVAEVEREHKVDPGTNKTVNPKITQLIFKELYASAAMTDIDLGGGQVIKKGFAFKCKADVYRVIFDLSGALHSPETGLSLSMDVRNTRINDRQKITNGPVPADYSRGPLNKALMGPSIRAVRFVSVKDCVKACNLLPGCTGFNYGYQGIYFTHCFLKGSGKKKKDDKKDDKKNVTAVAPSNVTVKTRPNFIYFQKLPVPPRTPEQVEKDKITAKLAKLENSANSTSTNDTAPTSSNNTTNTTVGTPKSPPEQPTAFLEFMQKHRVRLYEDEPKWQQSDVDLRRPGLNGLNRRVMNFVRRTAHNGSRWTNPVLTTASSLVLKIYKSFRNFVFLQNGPHHMEEDNQSIRRWGEENGVNVTRIIGMNKNISQKLIASEKHELKRAEEEGSKMNGLGITVLGGKDFVGTRSARHTLVQIGVKLGRHSERNTPFTVKEEHNADFHFFHTPMIIKVRDKEVQNGLQDQDLVFTVRLMDADNPESPPEEAMVCKVNIPKSSLDGATHELLLKSGTAACSTDGGGKGKPGSRGRLVVQIKYIPRKVRSLKISPFRIEHLGISEVRLPLMTALSVAVDMEVFGFHLKNDFKLDAVAFGKSVFKLLKEFDWTSFAEKAFDHFKSLLADMSKQLSELATSISNLPGEALESVTSNVKSLVKSPFGSSSDDAEKSARDKEKAKDNAADQPKSPLKRGPSLEAATEKSNQGSPSPKPPPPKKKRSLFGI